MKNIFKINFIFSKLQKYYCILKRIFIFFWQKKKKKKHCFLKSSHKSNQWAEFVSMAKAVMVLLYRLEMNYGFKTLIIHSLVLCFLAIAKFHTCSS